MIWPFFIYTTHDSRLRVRNFFPASCALHLFFEVSPALFILHMHFKLLLDVN